MNPSKRTFRQWRDRLRGSAIHNLAATDSGMAAVEFAMIAPVMIVLYFGVTEISDAYDAHTKATAVASTAADLIAQEKVVCDSEMTDVFSALSAIMFPYSSSDMKITISSLIDNGNGTVKVAWSDSQNDTPRTVNSSVTIPEGLVATGGSVIFAEVNFTYRSPTPYFFSIATPMTDRYYLHPRKVDQVGREVACTS
jgi:Flp pilus assembly protein TadG